jgi:hypothetical protein
LTRLDDDQPLGCSQGVGTVRDDESCQLQLAHSRHHGPLVDQVEVAGGLIEREDARPLVERPGEQKALLVSLILAYARELAAERGAPPVLLLDEIAAHLDPARRAHLFDELAALGAQFWATGADEDSFAPLAGRAHMLRVEAGGVVPA